MEDDRVAILEAQLSQAKLIAEEADKKYEEVAHTSLPKTPQHTHTHTQLCQGLIGYSVSDSTRPTAAAAAEPTTAGPNPTHRRHRPKPTPH